MTHFHPALDMAHTNLATWAYMRSARCLLVVFHPDLLDWMPTAVTRAVIDDFGVLVKVSA